MHTPVESYSILQITQLLTRLTVLTEGIFRRIRTFSLHCYLLRYMIGSVTVYFSSLSEAQLCESFHRPVTTLNDRLAVNTTNQITE